MEEEEEPLALRVGGERLERPPHAAEVLGVGGGGRRLEGGAKVAREALAQRHAVDARRRLHEEDALGQQPVGRVERQPVFDFIARISFFSRRVSWKRAADAVSARAHRLRRRALREPLAELRARLVQLRLERLGLGVEPRALVVQPPLRHRVDARARAAAAAAAARAPRNSAR